MEERVIDGQKWLFGTVRVEIPPPGPPCEYCGVPALTHLRVHQENCPFWTGRTRLLWLWKWWNRKVIAFNRTLA